MTFTFKFIAKIILIVLPCITFIKCNAQSPRIAEVNKEYKNDILKFGKKNVDHFPKKINTLPVFILVSENLTESHPKIWVKFTASTYFIDSLEKELKAKSTIHYSDTDSCLLIIDQHLNENNWEKFDKTLRYGPEVTVINKKCHKNKMPIPKFWEESFVENNLTPTGLNSGYVFYIIEAKSGLFLDPKKLPNGMYMPLNWEHGYSKGIAINQNKGDVIFWFDIW